MAIVARRALVAGAACLVLIILSALPVKALATSSPAALLEAARTAAATNQLDKSPISGPVGAKNPFSESPRGSVLMGLDVDLGKEGLSGIRPIYLTPQGVYSPKGFGSFASKTTYVAQMKAKAGYAVGAIRVKQADGVRAVNIVYMKINGPILDKNDSYESGWAGNTKVGSEIILDGHGAPLVGLHGNNDDDKIIGLGVHCLKNSAITSRPTATSSPAPGASSGTASKAEPGQTDPNGEQLSFADSDASDEAGAAMSASSFIVPLIMFAVVTVPLLVVGLMFFGKKSPSRPPRGNEPPPWIATGGGAGAMAMDRYEYQMPRHYDAGASNAATKSVTMGMIGLVAWCLPIAGIPVTIYGLTCGMKGLQSERAGMAMVGIILNAIGLILGALNAIAGVMMAMGKL